MIGLALVFSLAAMFIALFRDSKNKRLVLILFAATVITFFITYKLANPVCPPSQTCNSFDGLGAGIIGSIVSMVISIGALILSFQKKTNNL